MFSIIIFYGIACASIAFLFVHSPIFNKTRERADKISPILSYLLSCTSCITFWLNLACWLPYCVIIDRNIFTCVLCVFASTSVSIFIINKLFT